MTQNYLPLKHLEEHKAVASYNNGNKSNVKRAVYMAFCKHYALPFFLRKFIVKYDLFGMLGIIKE